MFDVNDTCYIDKRNKFNPKCELNHQIQLTTCLYSLDDSPMSWQRLDVPPAPAPCFPPAHRKCRFCRPLIQ